MSDAIDESIIALLHSSVLYMTTNQICICPMNTSLLFLIPSYVLSFKLGLNKFQAVQVAIATFYRLWTNPDSAMHSLINFLLREQTSKCY
jgi:hypothetical protein